MLWCHVAKTQTVAEYYLLQCYVRFNSVKRTSTNDSRYLLSFAWMRVDAERLQSPIIHSAPLPPSPPQIRINCCFQILLGGLYF